MIFDCLKNIKNYSSLIEFSDLIFEYLEKASSIAFSEWIEVSPSIKFIKLNSFSSDDLYEFHKAYTDIHITLQGIDEISIGSKKNLELVKEFNSHADYQQCKTKKIASLQNTPDFFCAIFPNEPHRNTFIQQNSHKIVFKLITSING